MTDQPRKNILPRLLEQNPSPVQRGGQDFLTKKRQQVDAIMSVFMQVLPSNYVSQVTGPFYTIQMQAAAEAIADFQLTAQEAFTDALYDYTRSEFLFQILGALVFPDALSDGYPTLEGDTTYRDFLKRMVTLLLAGAKKSSVEEGLNLLSDAEFQVIEKVLAARNTQKKVWSAEKGSLETQPGSIWGLEDQFEVEINVSKGEGDSQRFPDLPFVLQENARIVLRALKPAHTLYTYRHLFREAFGPLFVDTMSWSLDRYNYEDFRKFCLGAREISGTSGETLSDRRLFTDVTRDFSQVQPGADLVVVSGPNSIHSGGTEGTEASADFRHIGRYRVEEVLSFPVGADVTPRAYTTTPTGLTGFVTLSEGALEDPEQDWAAAEEGEVLTLAAGPNAGTYRLKTLLGNFGGPVGSAPGPATRVRVAPSLLRLDRRMRYAVSGQSYTVSVDRLGVQDTQSVEDEDVTLFFLE